jgi:flagellar biosynthesis/type III secretory pathway protein FliH
MTREELIAKSSEFIQEGFINILLNAFDEGYKKGYNDGKSDQEKSENISHVRFFDSPFQAQLRH